MWGGILAVLLSSSGLALNVDLETGEFSGNLYDLGTQLGTMLAGIIALVGRFNARTPISTKRRRRLRDYAQERE
ncbi:hypothetical protein CDO22_08705 [Sinorhizobium meliloti]|nr:hypothetical protein CDO22_08705 [Sinorhizobium meliloti]